MIFREPISLKNKVKLVGALVMLFSLPIHLIDFRIGEGIFYVGVGQFITGYLLIPNQKELEE